LIRDRARADLDIEFGINQIENSKMEQHAHLHGMQKCPWGKHRHVKQLQRMLKAHMYK
jgi:hypothetical protein